MSLVVSIAAIGLVLFTIGLVIGRMRLIADTGSRYEWGFWGWAWVAMFMSGTLFFGHSYSTRSVALDASAMVQLAWVAAACCFVLVSLPRTKILFGLAALPIMLFLLYGLFGLVTSVLSPAPKFSAYKAGLVVVDAILAAGFLSLSLRGSRWRVSDFVLGLIVLALGGALLGAVLWPGEAFQLKSGVFGVMLYGTLPIMHPNELGMWGGIVMVVSLVRWFAASTARSRWAWLFIGTSSATVVLLAQSRTSVAAILVSLLVAIPYLARTRAQALIGGGVLIMLAVGVVGVATVIVGPDTLFGPLVEYLKRGQDQGGLETMHGRVWAWMNIGWPMFMESPLIGNGFDAGTRFATDVTIGHLHNSFFQVLANSGLLGFIPWVMAVTIGSCQLFLRAWRRRSAPLQQRVSALVALLIMIGLLARAWTGSVLVSHAWSTMMFLGLMVDLYASRRSRVSESAANNVKNKTDVTRKTLLAHRRA
ncbi:uncharacterized protein FOKN1_0582 [Thiohalobacter thiocyanaticus]|uniref:O-antigen ligase-related domain-containing protein n=1 Tax=Thiohalobacter thiocyanaticus TaxID=585455 RepID=A0A1Z4VP34_9GAMM|nr:O-antigen ligase family protein [Thiohalobacter thiocyanaticus]BAZ92984.1 uncharacterized protein FOKN1_0582 [Thiohalobacter thiocyanaticus]